MKKITLLKMFFVSCVLFATNNIWSQTNITPVRTDVSGFSTWTDTDIAGTTYLQLIKATSSTISPAMNFDSYTGEALNFKARTYGGPSTAQATLTVSLSTDNGSTWTVLGTRIPTSSTLTAQAAFDLSSYNGTQVKIKFESLGASSSKGVGIDDITITGTATAPTITVSPTSLTGFSYYAGSGPSTEQSFTASAANLTADLTLSAPSDYEVSNTSGSGFNSSVILTPSGGSVAATTIYVRLKSGLAAGDYNSENITASSTGATNQTVACSGTVNAATPTITVTETSVPAFSAVGCSGTKTQTINVSGVYLTGDITLALSGANADQFSVAPATLTPTSGTVASTPVTITYTPTSVGSHSATLTLSSAGATDVTRALTGTASSISAPVATAATAEGNSGFTANWDAVTGATSYNLSVYKKSGTQTLEGFDSAPTAPTDWTFTSIASYTSSSTGYFATSAPSVKFDATGDIVLSPLYSLAPSKISFWIRGASTDATSALLVEGSADGSSWSTIEKIVPLPTTATVKTYTSVSSYKKFRFTYTKSVGNLAFDDFNYYGSDYVETPVSGSPFTGLTSTTLGLTGLQGGSTYYYTVTASNACGTTAASNEIMANTTATGVDNPTSGLKPYVSNGNIMVSASAGQMVDIYNTVGQKLVSKVATDGLNSISVDAKGVVIVKVGNSITKLAL